MFIQKHTHTHTHARARTNTHLLRYFKKHRFLYGDCLKIVIGSKGEDKLTWRWANYWLWSVINMTSRSPIVWVPHLLLSWFWAWVCIYKTNPQPPTFPGFYISQSLHFREDSFNWLSQNVTRHACPTEALPQSWKQAMFPIKYNQRAVQDQLAGTV